MNTEARHVLDFIMNSFRATPVALQLRKLISKVSEKHIVLWLGVAAMMKQRDMFAHALISLVLCFFRNIRSIVTKLQQFWAPFTSFFCLCARRVFSIVLNFFLLLLSGKKALHQRRKMIKFYWVSHEGDDGGGKDARHGLNQFCIKPKRKLRSSAPRETQISAWRYYKYKFPAIVTACSVILLNFRLEGGERLQESEEKSFCWVWGCGTKTFTNFTIFWIF